MLKFTYLALVLGALLTALAIGAWKKQRWLMRPKTTLLAIMTVAGLFIFWDVLAARSGHWSFNPEFTLGPTILGLPIEEWLFFVAIPLVSLAVWEVLRQPLQAEWPRRFRTIQLTIVTACIVLAAANITHAYSLIAAAVAAMTALLWPVWPQPMRLWLGFQGVMLVLFLIANTVLTALPIVEYGSAHYSGIRVGFIPLEDFLYNFSLCSLSVMTWLTYNASETTAQK